MLCDFLQTQKFKPKVIHTGEANTNSGENECGKALCLLSDTKAAQNCLQLKLSI